MKARILISISLLSPISLRAFASLLPLPAARAIVARAQPTSWSLPHRVEIGSGTLASRRTSQRETKRQSRQIPFAFCPEFFGDDPKHCSMCDGDTKVKGTCDAFLVSGDQRNCPGGKPCRGYYCKCSDNGGPDNSPKVTMSSVVNGQTGIVVWEPMTLDEYKGLRASTTVTQVETATSSGGGSPLETIGALVFAGGVAWYLASQNAAAGAMLFQPPAQRPEGSHEDDGACRNQGDKPECESCGGQNPLGLCSSGAQQNCPCEGQECPKDAPPECPAPDCSGSDSDLQCTAKGKLKGCQCCPKDPPKCEKDDCKANDKKKCQADKYKGCSCEFTLQPQDLLLQEPFPPGPDSAALEKQAKISLDKIWGGDLSKVPGYKKKEPPYCLHGATPTKPRKPNSYCMCGRDPVKTWSVKPKATNPCPWSPETPGVEVTFIYPEAEPTPAPNPEPKPEPKPEQPVKEEPCDPLGCGAVFCDPNWCR